jgi:hypothetical protein
MAMEKKYPHLSKKDKRNVLAVIGQMPPTSGPGRPRRDDVTEALELEASPEFLAQVELKHPELPRLPKTRHTVIAFKEICHSLGFKRGKPYSLAERKGLKDAMRQRKATQQKREKTS